MTDSARTGHAHTLKAHGGTFVAGARTPTNSLDVRTRASDGARLREERKEPRHLRFRRRVLRQRRIARVPALWHRSRRARRGIHHWQTQTCAYCRRRGEDSFSRIAACSKAAAARKKPSLGQNGRGWGLGIPRRVRREQDARTEKRRRESRRCVCGGPRPDGFLSASLTPISTSRIRIRNLHGRIISAASVRACAPCSSLPARCVSS